MWRFVGVELGEDTVPDAAEAALGLRKRSVTGDSPKTQVVPMPPSRRRTPLPGAGTTSPREGVVSPGGAKFTPRETRLRDSPLGSPTFLKSGRTVDPSLQTVAVKCFPNA